MSIFTSGFRNPDRERLARWQAMVQGTQQVLWARYQHRDVKALVKTLTQKDKDELLIAIAQQLGYIPPE